MNHGTVSRLGLGLSATLLLLGGCTEPDVSGMGSARVRIQAASTDAGEISLVTVSAQGGFETELTRDDSGAFAGTLLLPAGPNELVGRAFVGDELVGESAPVPVEIQAGFVTAASIRILDLTGGDDVAHGPLVLSLTHPMSALANRQVQLAVSAVDPDGDDLDITWSSDCDDDTFSSTSGAEVEWSKASAGSCRVSVTVSDGGLDTSESFSIVVFDEDQASGAVNVDGAFVSAPRLYLQLAWASGYCEVYPGAENGTCSGSISSPDRALMYAFADWGNGEPGALEITDDCGGIFESVFDDPFFYESTWLPPAEQSVCLITARATSAEGLTSELSAALLVREGTIVDPTLPGIFFDLSHANGFCTVLPEESEAFCEVPVLAGDIALFTISLDWGDLPPGDVDFFDTCGGFFEPFFFDPFLVQGDWYAPPTRTDCLLIAQAFGADGSFKESVMQIVVDGEVIPPPPPPPPPDLYGFVYLEHSNGSCEFYPNESSSVECVPMLAGEHGYLLAAVDWFSSEPALLEVRDDCGGELFPYVSDPTFFDGEWRAPLAPSECVLSVAATGVDGQVHVFDLHIPVL